MSLEFGRPMAALQQFNDRNMVYHPAHDNECRGAHCASGDNDNYRANDNGIIDGNVSVGCDDLGAPFVNSSAPVIP